MIGKGGSELGRHQEGRAGGAGSERSALSYRALVPPSLTLLL